MFYCNLTKTPGIPLFSMVSRSPRSSKPLPSFATRSICHWSSQVWAKNSYRREALEGVCRNAPLRFSGHKDIAAVMRIRCFSSGIRLRTLETSSMIRPRSATGWNPQRMRDRKILVKFWRLSNGACLKSLGSMSSMKTRLFSSVSTQKISESDRRRGGRALPWIASYNKEREAKRVEKRIAPKSNRSAWEESADSYFSRNSRVDNARNIVNNGSSYSRADEFELEAEEEEDVEPIDDRRWDKARSKYAGFIERESRYRPPEAHRWNKQETWGKKTWKEDAGSSLPKMVGQSIYGVGPVLAALTIRRREFHALYVQESLDLSGNNRKKKDKKGVEKVLKMAERIGLKVVKTSKHDLNMLIDNRPHQGLVLDASSLETVNVRELDPPSLVDGGKAPLWLALDEVTDPQNLGAIIRSAYFFGAQGVILCAKNSAPLSGVVSKASAGSLELIELMACKNMMQFLSSSIDNGWRVLGGSVSSRALPLSEVEARVPTILVLGSEGSGLRPLVERSCTQLIRIPGDSVIDGYAGETGVEVGEQDQGCSGQELKTFLAVESLNVSVAAGVLLYHLAGNK